jgi:hydrogenase maturation protease
MGSNVQTAVLGIGNPLCRDDGIGIHVIQAMRESGKYGGIELIDGGTAPDLLDLIDAQVKKLIIIDALKGGGPPGSIYNFELSDDNISEEAPVSLHGLGVLDSLLMMKKLGIPRPQVIVIGIEPADVSHGLKLSQELEGLVPAVIAAADKEIADN